MTQYRRGRLGPAAELTADQITKARDYLADDPRGLVMFELGLGCALRACEIAGVRWLDCVDASGKIGDVIRVRRAIGKKKSEGDMPLTAKAKEALAAWRKLTSFRSLQDPIICRVGRTVATHGAFTTANAVQKHLGNALEFIGAFGASSHSLRRSCLMHLVDKEVPLNAVREFARHADMRSIHAYIPARQSAKAAASRAADEL